MFLNETCRKHDHRKFELDNAFAPIYTTMFVLAVALNSLLLYVVMKKKSFVHEKRAFQVLFQVLISLDLLISILILPQILVKLLTDDHDVLISVDAFLAVRDFAISSQMVILVLIAIDRLLAFLVPLGSFWSVDFVKKLIWVTLLLVSVAYGSKFVILSVDIACSTKRVIDANAKHVIGISGGLFMLTNFIMYTVLFVFLCKRQVKSQRQSRSSIKFLKMMQEGKEEENSNLNDDNLGSNQTPIPRVKFRVRLSAQRVSISKKLGSIKFAKVLFGVNILMITSYLPGILYNGQVIKFPSYTVYYLFFLHALGDPILFMLTRRDIKRDILAILRFRSR